MLLAQDGHRHLHVVGVRLQLHLSPTGCRNVADDVVQENAFRSFTIGPETARSIVFEALAQQRLHKREAGVANEHSEVASVDQGADAAVALRVEFGRTRRAAVQAVGLQVLRLVTLPHTVPAGVKRPRPKAVGRNVPRQRADGR